MRRGRPDPRPGDRGRRSRLGTVSELSAEDSKIITLARSTRARTGAAEGAAVRDDTGRTYAACTVDLPSLKLSALQAAVAMAVSSGADDLEAAALVTADDTVRDADLAAVRDLGAKAPVLIAAFDGTLRGTVQPG
ncbi:cytidine deaminase [Actinomadura keratinilytica]|uniref:Cytidine deaminase n=1 Tax=Actinomadura keratinilytica TaxID=547461 RepID=A0ABP7Z7P7_9ACTN